MVKHVLFTIKGDILSGIPTTLETYEESVIPDKWAPKNFESADEDNITTEEFSDFITSASACEYFFDENFSKSELSIVIILPEEESPSEEK